IKTRKVGFLVDDGVSRVSVDKMRKALEAEGAQTVLISSHVGKIKFKEGGEEEIQHSYLTDASVCYDAFYTPDGKSVSKLAENTDYLQFINEADRHCNTIAFAKCAEKLAAKSFIKKDKGVIFECEDKLTDDFINVMKGHRVWERERPRKVPA